MKNIFSLSNFKKGVYTSVILFVLVASWGIFRVANRLVTTLDNINSAAVQANITLATINRPGTGTLAEIDKTIIATKHLTDHADLILVHEQQSLTIFDQQEQTIFAQATDTMRGLNGLVANLNQNSNQVSTDLNSLNQNFTQAQAVLSSLNTTVISANTLISDPNISQTLKNVNDTTSHVNNVAGDVEKVSNHFEQQIDTPKKMTWWEKVRMALSFAADAGYIKVLFYY